MPENGVCVNGISLEHFRKGTENNLTRIMNKELVRGEEADDIL